MQPLERALNAGWAALDKTREHRARKMRLHGETRPPSLALPAELARRLAAPPELAASVARIDLAATAAKQQQKLTAAAVALQSDLNATVAAVAEAQELRSARTRAIAEAEAAATAAAAEVASARAATKRAEAERDRAVGEMQSRLAHEGELKAETASERAKAYEMRTELDEQDVHSAALTTELALMHEVAAAREAELGHLRRQLDQRQASLAARTGEMNSVHQLGVRARLEAAAASARERAARRRAEQGQLEVRRVRAAYAELRSLASCQLRAVSSAAAAAGTRELDTRRDLLSVGSLLLQTHEALGTRHEDAPKLVEAQHKLAEYAYKESSSAAAELTTELADDPRLDAMLGAEGADAGLGADEAAAAAVEAAAQREEEEEALARAAAEREAAAALKFGLEGEASFLSELNEALTGERDVLDDKASAALAQYREMRACGTSVLRAEPSQQVAGYTTSDMVRARRARARAERAARRVDEEVKAGAAGLKAGLQAGAAAYAADFKEALLP